MTETALLGDVARQAPLAPPTFTERDASIMLGLADAHDITRAPDGTYVCLLTFDAWTPTTSGAGPRRVDAIWAALIAVMEREDARRCPTCGHRPPAVAVDMAVCDAAA